MKPLDTETKVIIFNNENEMQLSRSKNSVDRQYRCNICNKKYSKLSVLKGHKIRHKDKNERPFECTICPYKAASKRDLLRHNDQHLGHARQVHRCQHCTKTFKVKESLNEHIKSIHEKEVLYKCGKCSFSCWWRSTLRNHLKYHDLKVHIICSICDKTFKTNSSLKTHLRSHAGAKPYTCDQCDKSFILKNRLTRHIQAAHSPKNFECDICKKRFSTVHLLKRHSLIHSGEKPFKCCFCTYDSNAQGNLIKHVRRIHRLYHFTYKDLLKKQERVDDPNEGTPKKKSETLAGFSKEQIQDMIDRGKKTLQSHLKTLQGKGLTNLTYQELEKKEKLKKKLKEDLLKKTLEKKNKSKKSRDQVKNQKGFESKKITRNRSHHSKGKEKRKNDDRISFPSCNLSLPQMEDVTHPETDVTGVDGVTNNAPTIQVLWNINYPVSEGVKDISSVSKRKSKSKKKFSLKTKSKFNINRKGLKEKNHSTKDVSSDRTLLCRSENNLNSTNNLLEDNELPFHDKPLMMQQLHESENFSSGNCDTDLTTPLDNLRTDLVTFDDIESPNTIVITSDVNSYIDKVYKNVDLCNQFLHINEEEPHLICTFETVSSPHRESRGAGKLKADSDSTEQTMVKQRNNQNLSEINSKSFLSRNFIINKATAEENVVISASPNIDGFVDSQLPTNIINNSSRETEMKISVVDNNESSNLMITTHSLSNFGEVNSEVDDPKREMEEIILLHENENGETLSPLYLVNETSSSAQSLKEIIIKNSSTHRLNNDDMVVTSIAEIEQHEAEVIFFIS